MGCRLKHKASQPGQVIARPPLSYTRPNGITCFKKTKKIRFAFAGDSQTVKPEIKQSCQPALKKMRADSSDEYYSSHIFIRVRPEFRAWENKRSVVYLDDGENHRCRTKDTSTTKLPISACYIRSWRDLVI